MTEISRDVARQWLNEYFHAINEIEETALLEFVWSRSEDEYNRHIDFVWECLRAGIKPTHFVDTIAVMWKAWSDDIIARPAKGDIDDYDAEP